MTRCLFSYVNHVDAAATILSAAESAGNLAVSNVADPIVGRRHRMASLTGWGQADFGVDKTVGLLALVFPRDTTFPTAGTVRHQLDADGGTAGTGAAYDSAAVAIGTVEGYGYHVHVLPAAASARWWRWTFDVSGVAYVDVGRAWAGAAWQPDINLSYDDGDEWQDLSRISQAERSGAEYVDERPRRRVLTFGLDWMTAADRATARELSRIAGVSKQLVFCKDPDDWATETVLARIAESTPIRHRAMPIFAKAFVLRESL